MTGEIVQIQVNGDPREVAAGSGLLELLGQLALPPRATLVEYNGRALLRDEWDKVRLAAGDQVELLRIVAGG